MSTPPDKELVITRPGALQDAQHQFNWEIRMRMGRLEDVRALPAEELDRQLAYADLKGDTTWDAGSVQSMLRFVRSGVQLYVQRDVSRDLEISTLVSDLSHIAPPAMNLSIAFEDPELPECVVNWVTLSEGPGIKSDAVRVMFSLKGGGTMGVLMKEENWRAYGSGEYAPETVESEDGVLPEDDDNAVIRYMATLCMKVLAYASVPRLAPVKVEGRAARKQAGIHPKHFPLPMPLLVVRTLPRVTHERVNESTSTGVARRFMGRAGHLRFYDDERYVNVRGTMDWIPPIHPPDGVRVVYRVRRA